MITRHPYMRERPDGSGYGSGFGSGSGSGSGYGYGYGSGSTTRYLDTTDPQETTT